MMDQIQMWLNGPFPEEMKAEIRRLQKEDPQALSDAFFKNLSFGTGGMRGLMGVGPNRMNTYTIGVATQALANYLQKRGRVFIGYDVRHHSREFAEEAAAVLNGNGIEVLLSKDICPTPLVSFACRHFHCNAAIMITASHNPPQYNGYKVYWNDGAQVVPPHDLGIMEEAAKIHSPRDIVKKGGFKDVGAELDEAYLKELKTLQLIPPSPIQLLYTNLHGTGIRLMQKALASWGYTDLHFVEKQKSLDGSFPFAPSPNPEEEKALALGTEQLLAEKRDLLFATDPDGDRMGAVVLHHGKAIRLTGNQIASLCLAHICEKKKLPPNSACIKTIVTTELFRAIAQKAGLTCVDVLTGFKYIGEQILHWEKGGPTFVFGAEESYGYLCGTFVRDKDAISSSCILVEAAALAKQRGLTLIDQLYALYQTHGLHRESLTNITFPDTQAGMEQMQAMMRQLRTHPPTQIGDEKVVSMEDYTVLGHRLGICGVQSGPDLDDREERNIASIFPTNDRSKMGRSDALKIPSPWPSPVYLHQELLPKSDVLLFRLSKGSKLVVRPSGTEPKVKIYAEVIEPPGQPLNIGACDERLAQLVKTLQAL